ncbi:metal-dependent hydrolase [Saccharicrinis sp. 156]|uniref:metal-dependent hydrolase n=1 Tax=Saccharicrinis sp. 156 TaxID=3417574 RepID=UPI003D3347AB
MDILTHTLSGMAVGALVANQINGSVYKKMGILTAGTIAGAFPDIDVITMWSGFDGTFGRWFGLEWTGREAFGAKLWYSHHAFFHSLFAAVLFGLLLGCIIILSKLPIKSSTNFKSTLPYVIAFTGGYIIHILEDMATPGGGWGGVAFWWPSKNYIGGLGEIWWWNNYDVFLIVTTVVLMNTALLFLGKKIRSLAKKTSLAVFVIGFALSVFQIKNRGFDFAYHKNKTPSSVCEQKSKEIQKQILGNRTYNFMEWLDTQIPVPF